jgi:hypothetical protein
MDWIISELALGFVAGGLVIAFSDSLAGIIRWAFRRIRPRRGVVYAAEKSDGSLALIITNDDTPPADTDGYERVVPVRRNRLPRVRDQRDSWRLRHDGVEYFVSPD